MGILNRIRLSYYSYKIKQIHKRVINNCLCMTRCRQELERETGKTWEYAERLENYSQAIKKIKTDKFKKS